MAQTYNNLGGVFFQKGERDKAILMFKKARGLLESLVKMNPDNSVLKEQIDKLNAIIGKIIKLKNKNRNI
jgi:hypothetical protein